MRARDRSIDAVRAFAIGGVVAGHWLITGLVPGPDGVTTAGPLTAMPALAPLTWGFQTLGLLFFAAGYSAARHRTAYRGTGRHGTVRHRTARLLRPVLVLLAVWTLILFAGAALGTPTTTLRTIAGLVVSPLWFLLPYLALRVAAGPLRRILRRTGAVAVLPLLATVAAGDLGLVPAPAVLTAAWAIPWLLGMILAGKDDDHRATRLPASQAGDAAPWAVGTWAGAALALGGATVLAALILLAGYPVSAVGVPGGGRSNLDPPSLAAVALAVTQIGVFLMLRGPLTRLLRHDRAWRPVAGLNRIALPVYLWQQSALLAVTGAAALVNPAMPGLLTAPDSPAWIWQRLAWLPVFGVVLAVRIRGGNNREPDYLKPRLRGTLFDGS
jgi:peptidoglycan/LPS O-acetylase OafA/YrhL